jgi:ribose 5-phosphate isomerase B
MKFDESDIKRVVEQVVSEAMCKDEAKKVAIGSDHAGFKLKERLRKFISDELGYDVIDVGTYSEDSVDYPDIAFKVAEQVAGGGCFRGIIVDGAGIGSSIAANKIKGIRAALCHDTKTVINSREHNDANILTLGSGIVNIGLARRMVAIWLKTEFLGGRHGRRVDKIMEVEK